jgi:hypothetical protein
VVLEQQLELGDSALRESGLDD